MLLEVTKEEAKNYAAVMKKNQNMSAAHPKGLKVSMDRQKECIRLWREYPSFTYIRSKNRMCTQTVKKILDAHGVEY